MGFRSRIYLGELIHTRVQPVRHRFAYPVWTLAVDLDELDALDRRLRWFGHDRSRPVAIHDCDYLGEPHGRVRDKLEARLRAAGIRESPARVLLVTSPRVFGHAFNPVSFYFCARADGTPLCHVAEVNNTFGEGHVYVLGADQIDGGERGREPEANAARRYRAVKEFHVSPFNDVDGEYAFRFAPAGEELDVAIDLEVDGVLHLATRLRGTELPLDDRQLARVLLTRPFTIALALPRILRQAAALYLRHGLEFRAKPEPSSSRTYLSTRPPWIREFRLPAPIERLARRWSASRESAS
jgi:cyclopropane-fatty-acyl-phospholipid synthase